jgi:2-dehydropantoate 2-reductase
MTASNAATVVGAGGIGVALAWSLARSGWQVVLVERAAAKLAAARADGIAVDTQPAQRVQAIAFDDWQPAADALVLLCTKTYDNPQVLARIGAQLTLIPVQNGYDPLLEQHAHHGEGIASFVSECAPDRPHTRITRAGALHLGARGSASPAERALFARLAAALTQAGLFEVATVDDVRPYKATKLMYNAAISPLAASAGVDNAALLSDPLAKRLFFALLRENHAILRHAGLPLARIGPFHPDTVIRILRTPGLPELMAMFFRPSLRGTYCSMAPDIGSGRTEIAAYNGHLVRLAGNLPCPLNRAAVALVERISAERLAPHRRHLEAMLPALAHARGRP